MIEAKKGRLNLSSKCAVCGSKKSNLCKIYERTRSKRIIKLGIKTALSKSPLLGDLLF